MENLLFLGVPILKHIRVFLFGPSLKFDSASMQVVYGMFSTVSEIHLTQSLQEFSKIEEHFM